MRSIEGGFCVLLLGPDHIVDDSLLILSRVIDDDFLCDGNDLLDDRGRLFDRWRENRWSV